MNSNYQKALNKSNANKKKISAALKSLSKRKPQVIDEQVNGLHEEVFREVDCLQCANCCKTTSPIFEQNDIDRIAKSMKVSVGRFISDYLEMDEDGDFVLHSSPCAFLKEDNTCKIYEVRPKACAEYPHTNRKRMKEILDITYENAMICPAVSLIVERLKPA